MCMCVCGGGVMKPKLHKDDKKYYCITHECSIQGNQKASRLQSGHMGQNLQNRNKY